MGKGEMRKGMKSFSKKQGIAKRLFCFAMVFAMLVTMMPFFGKADTVKASEGDKNLTIHFMMPNEWGWEQPAIQFWGGTYTVTGNTNGESGTEIPGWGGVTGFFMEEGTVGDTVTEYTLSVQGTFTGFQYLDFKNTSNTVNPGYDSRLMQYTGDTPTDVYYIQKDGVWAYYLDADAAEAVPDLKPAGDTTFLLVGNLPGMAWDQTAEPNFEQSADNENIYRIVLKGVPAGNYEYKILQDAAVNGWNKPWAENSDNKKLDLKAPADVTISLDKTDGTKATDVKVSYIKDLTVEVPAEVQKGIKTELPAKGNYYAGDETGSNMEADVVYTAVSEGITLENYTLLVPSAYAQTEVVLQVSCQDYVKEITIPVVEKLYTYTIYYYDFNAEHMSADAADLWIWENGGPGGNTGYPFSGTETLSDGNTWLKATVSVPYTGLGIIARSKGTWNWQTGNILYENANAEDVTIYITSNSTEAYTEIPELSEPKSRYVIVQYDRPEGDYEGWNIYTWNSGFGSEVTVPVKEVNGKMTAKIPVKESKADLTLSFCMRRSEQGDEWAEKDGGDHYITVPAGQSVVKAVFTQGEGITKTLPYNTGYEMDGANDTIHFYYRDDQLSADDNLASLEGKAAVVVNQTAYPMTYDAAADRFFYDLKGVVTGDYYYYYQIDGADMPDVFNSEKVSYEGKECSVCHFKKADASVSAVLSQPSMDYNDNNVLSVSLNAADGEALSSDEIASVTADLSELGLSKNFVIDTTLMEGTISCLNTVSAGTKTIPVTVKDIYGNVYTADAGVEVTERVKESGDFDWDEAVIYFTVTDRFFDGNAANNDAYGVLDYNTGEKGGSSYHGGDFAGLNAKLDELKNLGINTIWITPIVENITEDQHDNVNDFATYGYHGYWAGDFTKLNKHLGSEEEFAALLDAAHAKGMKVMVDVVLNHAGYGTEDYFNSILFDENGSPVKMIRDSSNTITGDDKYDSLSGLPDFATENKQVADLLIQWQTDWMSKYDIDYYRVDTVKHVETTTWAAFKNALTKVNPDFKMIGEYAGAGYANTAGELASGTMDSLLDFDFNDFAQSFVTGNISSVENSLQKRNATLNHTAMMGSFLSSHDEDTLQYKLVKEAGLSGEQAYSLMKIAATLQITAKGQPVIYYGEEIGLGGANDWPQQTNRRDFDWAELERQKADAGSIYNHYKTMLSIRNAYTDVFARGNRQTAAASDAEGYEVITRSYGGTTLYVGMNIKETAKQTVIPVSESAGAVLTDLYDGKEYTVSAEQTVTLDIPAAKDGGTVVLVLKDSGTPEVPNEPDDNGTEDGNTGDADTPEDSGSTGSGASEEEDDDDDSSDGDSSNRTAITVQKQVAAEVLVTGGQFADVIDMIEKAQTGAIIYVRVGESTVVPKEVFASMKGKDVTVIFKISDAVSWSIKGTEIGDGMPFSVDLGVTLGQSSIPAEKVSALSGKNPAAAFSIRHDGPLGFTGTLKLFAGKEHFGKYANLYYYNEEKGMFEYRQAAQVKADGYVEYTFDHASQYVVVFSEKDLSAMENSVVLSPKTSDSTPAETAVILLLFGCMACAAAYRKYRRIY